ncbi:MAG TPA: hypothetical protein VMU04_03810 [Candidatus Acidoferrum sp.]|nr:hypothetical protein [Candidatus Acidoferrum sp.]
MKTFSHYGVGVKVHAIERRPDGGVEFTLWFAVFFIPIFPLSSWSAVAIMVANRLNSPRPDQSPV